MERILGGRGALRAAGRPIAGVVVGGRTRALGSRQPATPRGRASASLAWARALALGDGALPVFSAFTLVGSARSPTDHGRHGTLGDPA